MTSTAITTMRPRSRSRSRARPRGTRSSNARGRGPAGHDHAATTRSRSTTCLPGETDDAGSFQRFAASCSRARPTSAGCSTLRRDAGRAEVCIHYDPHRRQAGISPTTTTPARARCRNARRGGAHRQALRADDLVRARARVCAQRGPVIEHDAPAAPGVLAADVAYAAERVVVEYDTDATKVAIDRARGRDAWATSSRCPEHGPRVLDARPRQRRARVRVCRCRWPSARAGAARGRLRARELRERGAILGRSHAMYVVALVAAAIFPLRAAITAIRARSWTSRR